MVSIMPEEALSMAKLLLDRWEKCCEFRSWAPSGGLWINSVKLEALGSRFTLHTFSQRCALLSSCSGCERRSAGKQSGDVTALLSGCPALTARPEKQSAEDRQQKDGNQGKHRVTKRCPALSYPMFTLVTGDLGIVGRWRAVCVTALQRPNSDAAAIRIVVVVYEHRSRLERSLQKEKSEHKKTKEDYLVYKLEAQEALNKEKQDSMNRYGALSSQHKILKNQNEEMKKQLSDLQVEQSNLKLQHSKTAELQNQKLTKLQREKENEIVGLQDTISKLREESKLLRRAHQDVHTQLLGAQAQMEEFRQLKDALKKMPSFKDSGTDTQHQQFLAANKKDFKEQNPQVPQISQGSKKISEDVLPGGRGKQLSHVQPGGQESSLHQSPSVHLAPIKPAVQNDSHVSRFTRTVNSLPAGKEIENQKVIPRDQKPQNKVGPGPPGVVDKKTPTASAVAANKPVSIHSWQDIVNKVNARITEADNKNRIGNALAKPVTHHVNVPTGKREPALPQESDHKMEADDELQMDAGVIDREEAQKLHVGQDTPVLEDAADPAKDPNNQGEDEFEEAEIDRPEFEEKGEVGKKCSVYEARGENGVVYINSEQLPNVRISGGICLKKTSWCLKKTSWSHTLRLGPKSALLGGRALSPLLPRHSQSQLDIARDCQISYQAVIGSVWDGGVKAEKTVKKHPVGQ
ncbi:unnamed protein product [Ranitomeya imitator]|uniref:Golgi integral membrane protein 4 n=1 Tax=Ranitomeya imitator TaxID=111125 RepID=A0ABN9MJY7_9NEOB|nr:unnamed protein product [Ranitomeya imitator]